ncbi:hypothetical protein LguiA_020881 [Lonicera macranthoides]
MDQSTNLHKNLADSLQINDDPNKHNYDEDEELEDYEDEEEEDDLTEAILAQSGYFKSDPKSDPPNLRTPLPLAQNLRSAMKGSREKEGIPEPVERRVKFEDGVYDPPPTAGTLVPRTSSVTVQMRIEKKMEKEKKKKKKGKGEVKGKGKGKSKDKKQGSNRCFNSLDDDDDEF